MVKPDRFKNIRSLGAKCTTFRLFFFFFFFKVSYSSWIINFLTFDSTLVQVSIWTYATHWVLKHICLPFCPFSIDVGETFTLVLNNSILHFSLLLIVAIPSVCLSAPWALTPYNYKTMHLHGEGYTQADP